MTRIDRVAWKRIKERVANPEPRTVTFYKGRSCGFTQGLLEQLPGVVDELRFADGNRLRGSSARSTFKARTVGPSTRFSIEQLFKDSDQGSPVVGSINR